MRELIYLSNRKLEQFYELKRSRRWPGFDKLSAKAPMGLGEFEVTMADRQTASEHPDLAKALRHITGLRPRPAWYFEGRPEPGQWVRFDARLNYRVVEPVVEPLGDEPAGPPFCEPALLFWQPQALWNASQPRLLLHGSPEHLVGAIQADPSSERQLRVPPSLPMGLIEFLGLARRPSLGPASATRVMSWLLDEIDDSLPSQMASRMSGYARVTFEIATEWPDTARLIIASPLYVEHAYGP
ncbi:MULTISPECIES: SAVMC3_10250 family protein [unclassified Kitasatospora]|uniref:SAVMC3_10250 family protein n=1 Tax=unclassified Kitasatospora TaxID=2633591 RepID=UPI0033DC097C